MSDKDIIYRQDAIRLAEQGQIQGFEWQFKKLCELPSAQPKTQKLLDDGTLVVHTDIDIIKITRVNIAQNNTHYGDLFYRDEE